METWLPFSQSMSCLTTSTGIGKSVLEWPSLHFLSRTWPSILPLMKSRFQTEMDKVNKMVRSNNKREALGNKSKSF